MADKLLEVYDLKTYFYTEMGVVRAVDGVSYYVDRKEIVGIVGESGCGKSVSQLSVMRLITPPGVITNGEIIFEGRDLLKLSLREMRLVRGKEIAMIFQEPMTSLNPTLTVGWQVQEMLMKHLGMTKKEARFKTIELLELVGIPDAQKRVDDYPHQFSGGMRQRVMIAMAISCRPKLIIADEPTTALDVTTQAQLLDLMCDIVNKLDSALVIVTHNLGIVARYVHRIYIMYAGKIVEAGTTEQIFKNPLHPYTKGLLKSIPRIDRKNERLITIPGSPPDLIQVSSTCAFLPRCVYKKEKCFTKPCPPLREVEYRHHVSCYLYADNGS